MEPILKYKNRDKLYQFLIDNFGLIKVKEHYDKKFFGNFYILLSSTDFLLSYINDRGFIDIHISSKLDTNNFFSLSFIQNFIYDPNHINSNKFSNNEHRIDSLNKFLQKDFYKISELFNEENYFQTKKKIDSLLESQFNT